ncbi:MAG: branched-chain amino acid ABC transporter permease [Actinomycetales bacterium]|nr:branched-chain amino acid ABC transporter permease [Actinomycetales bacterium]
MDWSTVLTNAATSLVGLQTIVYALAAVGLNLHFGYTGLLNFGQAAFAAVGAYGLAIVVASAGLPLPVGLAAGLAGSVVLSVLLGLPTLRLRADYLAIATIAAAEILRISARSSTLREFTGGASGINGFTEPFHDLNPLPPGTYGFGPWRYHERDLWVLLVGWTVLAVCCLVVWLLVRSPWGRVLRGIREDEDAARGLGKNVYAYKMQALAIGGVIGTLAGFVYALGQGSVQPDLYGTELTFFAYTVLLLGGVARVLGPVVGAAIFWVVLSLTDTVLRGAVDEGWLTFMSTTQVGQVRFMLVGLALMFLMIFRPQGIFGDPRQIALDAR